MSAASNLPPRSPTEGSLDEGEFRVAAVAFDLESAVARPSVGPFRVEDLAALSATRTEPGAPRQIGSPAPARSGSTRERRRRTPRRRGWLVRRALITGDVLALLGAGATLAAVAGQATRADLLLMALTLGSWIAIARLHGLYSRDEERADHTTIDDLGAIVVALSLTAWPVLVGVQLLGRSVDVLLAGAVWTGTAVILAASRALVRGTVKRQSTYRQNTIILGAGDVGQLVAEKIVGHPEYGMAVVGFVDADPRERSAPLRGLRMLGTVAELPMLVRLFDVERVIIAFSGHAHEQLLGLVRVLERLDVQVDIVPRLFEVVGPRAEFHTVGGLPVVGLPPLRLSRAARCAKRGLDLVVAGAAVLVLAPVLVAVAVAVRLESPGPVFYRSERIGEGGRLIRLLKFRSMRAEFCRGAQYGGTSAEDEFARIMSDPAVREEYERTHKLVDDPRLTRLGGIMRRTSLDELPQLLNVLRGDVTLVGPRPITRDELVMLERAEAAALGAPAYWQIDGLRPGVTGYWQIHGRSSNDYRERLRLDAAYAASWSVRLDLLILGKTFRVLLSAKGAH